MSAVNPDQFEQLPMFMTARDLMGMTINDGEVEGREGNAGMLRRKVTEAKLPGTASGAHPKPNGAKEGPSLHEAIAAEGVREPVVLDHGGRRFRVNRAVEPPMIYDGYHRAATAHDVDPGSYVPVQHVGRDGGEIIEKNEYI